MILAPGLVWVLGGTMAAYVVGLYAMCLRLRGRIQTTEDFLVAGRRLTFPFATATILATWFGAGTVLTAADEVRRTGLSAAALEPVGAGVCLLLAGLFLARPVWEMKLLTLSDLFRTRYSRSAEVLSALIIVPSYFGWVAAQFVALAGMLQLFFDLDMRTGILLVALVGMGYTFLGGMWSVTLTDAVQMVLVLAGLLALGWSTFAALGSGSVVDGVARLWAETPPSLRTPIPLDSLRQFLGWLSVLAVGSLGNLPSQDLFQRVFASKTSAVARRACLWSGGLYILFGLIPVSLGLAGRLLFPETLDRAILPALAHGFSQPFVAVTFTVMLVSAVLSSIDSGILAPAAVLSENVFRYLNRGSVSSLALNRISVLVVASGSLVMAYAGRSAYSLLEESYALPLVALFVPMMIAIYGKPRSARPAIAAMLAGAGMWFVHWILGWEFLAEPFLESIVLPVPLSAVLVSLASYVAVNRLVRSSERPPGAGA